LEKLPFFILAMTFALVALLAQQNTGALRPVQQYFVAYRIGQSFYGICIYIWKSILPIRLSPLYELPFDFETWMPLFLICGTTVVSISVSLYLLRHRWPALLACWVYYLVMLAPVSGIAQSGPQLTADRYSYLSCLSCALLLGGVFFRFWKSVGQGVERRPIFLGTSAVAVLVVIILGIMTWKQTSVWRNSKILWEHVIVVAPESSIARYNLGRVYENEGRLEESLDHYRRAVSLNPTFADAHYNLARLLAKRGLHDEAVGHYRQALRFKPNDVETRNNLGLLLAARGETAASLEEFQKAVQIDPSYGRAFFNMGRVYASEGDLENASRYYRVALKLNPTEAEVHLGLGIVLARQNQLDASTIHFREAVKLRPEWADAYVALAKSLAAQGKKDEAAKQYEEALRLLRAQKKNGPSR
jgi:tetratricopeptide (TPR) repeat protein